MGKWKSGLLMLSCSPTAHQISLRHPNNVANVVNPSTKLLDSFLLLSQSRVMSLIDSCFRSNDHFACAPRRAHSRDQRSRELRCPIYWRLLYCSRAKSSSCTKIGWNWISKEQNKNIITCDQQWSSCQSQLSWVELSERKTSLSCVQNIFHCFVLLFHHSIERSTSFVCIAAAGIFSPHIIIAQPQQHRGDMNSPSQRCLRTTRRREANNSAQQPKKRTAEEGKIIYLC